MIQVVYTNSNCSDVVIPFAAKNRKYSGLPLYVISDYTPDISMDGLFNYDNSDPYYEVWSNALRLFGSEYFIYLQEDFILYDKVDNDRLEQYKMVLEQSDYSFVRLLKSGRNLGNREIYENLYEIESSNQDIFSMQATIWKTEDYIKIMETVKDKKWLENERYRREIMKFGIKGLYHYDNEPKVGENHHNSNVYPYVATAIVRGCWNYREYKEELEPILTEFNIDPSKRGLF